MIMESKNQFAFSLTEITEARRKNAERTDGHLCLSSGGAEDCPVFCPKKQDKVALLSVTLCSQATAVAPTRSARACAACARRARHEGGSGREAFFFILGRTEASNDMLCLVIL